MQARSWLILMSTAFCCEVQNLSNPLAAHVCFEFVESDSLMQFLQVIVFAHVFCKPALRMYSANLATAFVRLSYASENFEGMPRIKVVSLYYTYKL